MNEASRFGCTGHRSSLACSGGGEGEWKTLQSKMWPLDVAVSFPKSPNVTHLTYKRQMNQFCQDSVTIYWFSYSFFALIYKVFIIRFPIFFFFFFQATASLPALPALPLLPSDRGLWPGGPAAPHSPPNDGVNVPDIWNSTVSQLCHSCHYLMPLNKRADRRCVHVYARPYKESPSYRRRGGNSPAIYG